jgi:glycosyltransferase involved in cell wall biosynthesis
VKQRPIVLYFSCTFVWHQNGAHARVAALLRFLVDCGCSVVLYSFSNHPECPWGDAEIAVPLILDRRSERLRYWTKAKKLLSSIIPSLTPKLLSSSLPGATPNFDQLKLDFPGALYFVNYANGLLELNGIDPAETIIETHDLDFIQFSKRYGHSLSSRKIARKYRSEVKLLESAGALIGIAPTETGLFRMWFPSKTVFFVPDYGVAEAPAGNDDPALPVYDVLFVGSENVFNIDGIVEFMHTHRAFIENHRLAIVGRVSHVAQVITEASALTNVELLGFVDDIDDLYRQSKIVISPVEGTGLKIKVVEALAAGKPVFGSQHTIDGLPPGSEGCVFALDAKHMSAMLATPKLLASTGAAARQYAQDLSKKGDADRLRSFLFEAGCSPEREAPPERGLNISSEHHVAETGA